MTPLSLGWHTVVILVAFGVCTRAAPATAQDVQVKIELVKVKCNDPEDVGDGDEFYATGAFTDGKTSRAMVTKPVKIKSKQDKEFAADHRVGFDAKVASGGVVKGGFAFFDEDLGKDWAKHKDMVKSLTDKVSAVAAASGNPAAIKAAVILKIAEKGAGVLLPLDHDDFLGKIKMEVPADGPATETKTADFVKRDRFDWSGYNYTVTYRITRTK